MASDALYYVILCAGRVNKIDVERLYMFGIPFKRMGKTSNGMVLEERSAYGARHRM